ncbi:hypothetical protein B0E53_04504 [Micromonospora sp. MH33]|nr:hypothetical protein B0E53_04504 [Micromonospora sp. MH33]
MVFGRRWPLAALLAVGLGSLVGAGRVAQPAAGRAGRQAGVRVAPGVQVELVAGRAQRRRGEGLKDGRAGVHRDLHTRVGRQRVLDPGDRGTRREGQRRGGAPRQPGPGRAAVVHPVVQQPGVPAHRGAQPGGGQVRLGGDRVLPVGEPVPHVREQLGEGDQRVGRVAVGPAGQQHGQPVEQPGAQPRVVAGQVVQGRGGGGHRGAAVVRPAVQFIGAVDGEGERAAGQRLVEAGREAVAARAGEGEQVAGPVPAGGGAHHQHPAPGGGRHRPGDQRPVGRRHPRRRPGRHHVRRVRPQHPHRVDPRVDPHPAEDADPAGVEAGGDRAAHQVHEEGALAGRAGHVARAAGPVRQHLDVVDTVEGALPLDERPAGLPVEQRRGHGVPPTTVRLRRSPTAAPATSGT